MMSIVVNLKEHTVLNHDIALNAVARLQSYYMAKSALGFSKLLLLYNKKIESQISQTGVSGSTLGAMGYQPLYKMFPLSSELLRGVAEMATSGGGESDSEPELPPDEAEDSGGPMGDTGIGGGVGMLQREKFEEFLDFEGDFSVEIEEDAAQYSLNAISKMTPTSASYDLHKKILLGLLMRPQFKTLFDNQNRDAEELVHAIADYVDANDQVNQFDQVERGREDSAYKNVQHKPKNAKMQTLSELRLIPGMNDDLFANLEPLVSVFNSSDKMNVCLGEEDLLDAVIIHYSTESGCVNPIDPKDHEFLKELRDEVLPQCPDVNAMANVLNIKLGVKSEQDVSVAATSGTAESQETSSQVGGCKVQFKDLLTNANNVFTIRALGVVGEVRTTLKVVLDTNSSNAATWKTLFYQIE